MHSNTHWEHQDKFFPALSDGYQRTKELLQQNKESIQKVAERLLKKEVIFKGNSHTRRKKGRFSDTFRWKCFVRLCIVQRMRAS